MKVSVHLTLDVSPEEWDLVHDSGDQPADVRADVRRYVLNHVQQAPGVLETDATVTVKGIAGA